MLYHSGKTSNQRRWNRYRSMLKSIFLLRRDYPPMMALLCGEFELFFLNRYHLKHCMQLYKESKPIVEKEF
jgi:hypothetical protein